MVIELIFAVAISGILMYCIWFICGTFHSPITLTEGTKIEVQIHVSGHETSLEKTVKDLLWFRENGVMDADITIIDSGMDEETKFIAEILTRNNNRVYLAKGDAVK